MNVGFIGTGNMGGALINGLKNEKTYSVFVYDTVLEKAKQFDGVSVCASLVEIAQKCDILVLTVKPTVYTVVLGELSANNYKGIIVSVAAGITTDFINQAIPSATVVRTMPNTPALVGEGMTLIANHINKEALNQVDAMFSLVGKTVILDENLMEAGTALSGSSPAIIYHLVDVMANNALSYGIPKKQAIEIAAQTVFGSAKMVLDTKKHPAELVDNVCSPGGTTISAMNTLAKNGFEKTVLAAMDACVEKTYKMKK